MKKKEYKRLVKDLQADIRVLRVAVMVANDLAEAESIGRKESEAAYNVAVERYVKAERDAVALKKDIDIANLVYDVAVERCSKYERLAQDRHMEKVAYKGLILAILAEIDPDGEIDLDYSSDSQVVAKVRQIINPQGNEK